MALGGIISAIGGIAGAQAGAGDRAKGTDAINDAYQKLAAIGLPPDTAKAIIYNQYKQAGTLTPELEKSINEGPSNMAGVSGNADAQKAQMQALQILQQTGQTGMTPQSQAALNQIRQQVATDTNAKQQAIQQQFAARGQGGSGAELIGALQAAQSGANQESTAGDQVSAQASQNALQAIGQAGTLGGQIQQQQFGEQAQKAQAQDVINQFNTQNQVNQQARNVGAQNQAQGYNLGQAQQLSNANTQQANQELLRQNQAQMQDYNANLNRLQTINSAAGGYNNGMQAAGSAASQAAAAPYQAVGAGITSGENAAMKAFAASDGSPDVPQHYSSGTDYARPMTDFRSGGQVPGHAPVHGDSPRNDIVPAMLSPGEQVVPRSLSKTSFGKKLAKLLEQHHEVMEHAKNGGH